jgi:hypothetical protein
MDPRIAGLPAPEDHAALLAMADVLRVTLRIQARARGQGF